MEWTIYSIGDSAFLEQVLNAVAMLTGTGDFNDAIRIGFLLGVLMLAFQAVLRPMSMIQFQYTLIAFLAFSFLYGPGQRVLIEDAYTGDMRAVDNVPLGVAASGGIISNAGYAITKLFETAFSTPEMTKYGFGSQLDELGLIQKAFSTPAGLGRANAPSAGDDVRMSWYNYIKECTLVGVDGEAQRLAGFYQSRYGMQGDAAFFAGGMMALDRAAANGDSGANDMLVGFAARALGSDAGHQTGDAGANLGLFSGAPAFGATRQQIDAAGLTPVAGGGAARGAAASRIQGALAGADQAINDHRANGADAAAQHSAQWGGAVDGQRAMEIEGDMLKWVQSKTGMAQTVGEAAWGTMKTTDDALRYADQSIRGAVQGLIDGKGISAGVGDVMAGYHDAHQRYAVAELGMTQAQAQYWADIQMAPLERAVGAAGGDPALSLFDTRAQASRAAVISEAGGKSVVADAIRSSAATGSEANAKMVGSWNRAAGLLQ